MLSIEGANLSISMHVRITLYVADAFLEWDTIYGKGI